MARRIDEKLGKIKRKVVRRRYRDVERPNQGIIDHCIYKDPTTYVNLRGMPYSFR